MAKDPWAQFQDAPDDFQPSQQGMGQVQKTAFPQQSSDPYSQFQDAPGVDRSTNIGVYAVGDPRLPDVELDDTGAQEYARPEDFAFASRAQELFDTPGSTRAQFDALSDQYGYPRYGEDLDKAIANRDAAGAPARISVPLGGQREPIPVLSDLANSSFGAALGAAGDVGAMGLSDEIAGLAGGDSFKDVIGGEGEAQRRAQLLKDAAAEAYPVETATGGLAGGLTSMMGIGKLASPARTLIADTAFGAGYGAGSSNDNRIVGAAIGAGAAASGSYFGGKLLDKIANRGPSKAAQAVEQGQKFGIDMPMGATGRGKAIIEKGLDNLPGSAGTMQAGRDVLSEQVSDAVENVAKTFGPTTSFSGIGEAAQAGAKKWIDKFQATAGKAYDAIPIKPGADSSLTNTIGALSGLNGKFSSNAELAMLLNNTRLSKYLDALAGKVKAVPTGVLDASGNPIAREVQTGGKLSWQDMKDFRSRIGEEIGDHLFSDGTMKSELRALYAALSEDMKATAVAQGPSALRAFERANTLFRQGQERIDGALVKLLGNDSSKAAESAAAKIQAIARDGKASADLATLAEIRKSLPAEEWAQVQNGVIRLLGQPANSAGREFDPNVFVRTFSDMAPEARNLFFGKGELRQNLNEFVGVMENLAKVNAMRNTSQTAPNLVGAAVIGSTLLNPILLAQAASAGVANYSLAKLWTNPRFVKWATGYARMARTAAQKGGEPNVGKQLDLLKKVAVAEPAIAQDALGLQRYLAQQFNQSPGKLAAEEQSESVDGPAR